MQIVMEELKDILVAICRFHFAENIILNNLTEKRQGYKCAPSGGRKDTKVVHMCQSKVFKSSLHPGRGTDPSYLHESNGRTEEGTREA